MITERQVWLKISWDFFPAIWMHWLIILPHEIISDCYITWKTGFTLWIRCVNKIWLVWPIIISLIYSKLPRYTQLITFFCSFRPFNIYVREWNYHRNLPHLPQINVYINKWVSYNAVQTHVEQERIYIKLFTN